MNFIHLSADWMKQYESVAIWLEGIALAIILFVDIAAQKGQHKESAAQMEIWRKQIHADRVAEIFRTLRRFSIFVSDGVHFKKTIGPCKDFSEFGDLSNKGGRIFQEYLDLQEAYYLSYLVSPQLPAYMKQRMEEADRLQRIPNSEQFQLRFTEFQRNWDVYELAAKIRELS